MNSQKKQKLVIGVDEVGRGAFAGPLVAAAVVFPLNYLPTRERIGVIIKDSKKMNQAQRTKSSVWICKNAVTFGVGVASVSYINTFGLTKANLYAFSSALECLKIENKSLVHKILIDGKMIPSLVSFKNTKLEALVKGDSKIFSISAASIVAKVYRDTLMEELAKDTKHKKYLWQVNKGYGTKAHRRAIREFGITPHHRKLFVRKTLGKV